MTIFRLYKEIFIKSSNWNIAVFQFCTPIQQRASIIHISQFCSVTQSSLSLQFMVCSRPGFPVHHQLPEPAQTHVHRVSDAMQPSHPLSSPSPLIFNLSWHKSLSQCISSSHQVAKVSQLQLHHVLPMNIEDWYPLRWSGVIFLQSKGLSRVFFNTTAQKHQFFGTQLFHGPTLTSIHDYWKNHSLD